MRNCSKLAYFGLIALFTSLSTVSLADNRVVIDGKQYKPSYKECKKALTNGTLIPHPTQESRVAVFYNDRFYTIVAARRFICVAWKYK